MSYDAVERSDMGNRRISPSLIVILLSVFARAFAQVPAPSLELFLEGGTSFSNTGSATETLVSPALACPAPGCAPLVVRTTGYFPGTIRPTAGTRYRFTRSNALEASYSYSHYRFAVQQSGEPAFAGYNRADQISFNYVRYLSAKARVQPFLTAGLGINGFSAPKNAPAVVEGYVNADNGWHLAGNFGGGADLVLERHFALRMELRDYITCQPPSAIKGPVRIVTGPGTSHNVVPSLGMVFRFK